jgi:hypothetical protein
MVVDAKENDAPLAASYSGLNYGFEVSQFAHRIHSVQGSDMPGIPKQPKYHNSSPPGIHQKNLILLR